MLQNKNISKKSFLVVLLCFLTAGLIFAQSAATEKLINDRLSKADDCYANMQYKEAYNFVNSALALSPEKDEVPGRVYLLAQQIYRKFLEQMANTKNFKDFEDVLMRVQQYPKIGDDPQVQKNIKIIQQMQADIKDAARDAKNREMMQDISAKQQAQQQEMVESLTASTQESNKQMLETLSDKMNANTESMVTSISDKMLLLLPFLLPLLDLLFHNLRNQLQSLNLYHIPLQGGLQF
mgnify:CR=1 FL=1